MKEIPLTQGKFAVVDDEDYEELSKYKWHACKNHNTFYAARVIKTGNVFRKLHIHQAILGVNGSVVVDHKDRDGLNNCRANLRIATNAQNIRNSCNPFPGHYKGVSWHTQKSRWRSQIKYRGRMLHLGYFKDKEEAARSYDAASYVLFGDFGYLNFPEEIPCLKLQQKVQVPLI